MNNPVLVWQPSKNCLHGEKPSHISEISPALRLDRTWVRSIHSHINDLFSQSEIYRSAEISLRWDISPRCDDFHGVNCFLDVWLGSLCVSATHFWLKIYITVYSFDNRCYTNNCLVGNEPLSRILCPRAESLQ